jgi:hypothetical protein
MIKYVHRTSGRIYRVSRKKADGVYLLPESIGYNPPRGMSIFRTNEQLKENYDSYTKHESRISGK